MSDAFNDFTRRGAIALGAIVPAAASAEPSPAADLIRRAREGNDAFVRGDMRTWYALAGPIAEDFSLMAPFGGQPSQGFDRSDAYLDRLAARFRGGEATFELIQSYATGDMVALVFIERQRLLVDDLPLQDWSLRVTQIYRRSGGHWEMVHRHADPLTHFRDAASTAILARGE